MTTIPNAGLLRVALVVDAAMSGASGLLLAAATGPVAQATALPAGLLGTCGWFFLAYAGALAWLARRAAVPGRVVGVLAAGNLAWAGGCVAVPALGLVAPAGLGIALLAAQGLAVSAFAAMYAVALRRADGGA